MPNPARTTRRLIISKKNRALLTAALLALEPAGSVLRSQVDLSPIRSRAEQGDPEALNALANAYANGQGVAQSFPEALRLYQQASDRGLAAAQFNLGMMHELGRGVGADLAVAFKFYLKAAEQGFAPAQFNVGNMYANGVGVKQDYFEAALWFRQAADREVAEAQYNLALAYELGRGVAKDETAAQRWYRLAAGQRYARAQYNLALMLEEGRGSAPDPAGAIALYRAAAAQNFAPAQNNLGILLAEGRGAPANLLEAYTWLALAVENGAKPTGRDLVAQQLTSGQLTEANASLAKLRAQLGLGETVSGAVVASARLPAASGPTPAVAASGVAGPDAATLNSRVAAIEAELGRARAENSRLGQSAQALAREKSTLEQRLAAAEGAARVAPAKQTGSKEAATLRTQIEQLTREKAEAQRRAEELAAQLAGARATPSSPAGTGAADAPLPQLAASDPRIAKLIADNARLNDDVKRSTIELAQLGRQLRLAQEKTKASSGPADAAGTTPAPAEAARLSELTRQFDDLRTANEKLAAENRRLSGAGANAADAAKATQQLVAVQAELDRIVAENQQLKQSSAAAAELPGLRKWADQVEQSLAETSKQRDGLLADKAALEKRLAETKPKSGDPEQMQQMRAQLGEALDELAAARRSSDTLKTQLEQTKQALAAAEADKSRVTTGAAQAESSQISDLRRALVAAQESDAANRDALAKVRAQLEQATRGGEENSRTASNLAMSQRELAATRQQLAETQSRLAAAQQSQSAGDAAAQRLAEVSRALATVTAERDRLVATQPAVSSDRGSLEKLTSQLETASRTIAELSSKNDSLQKDLEVARQSTAAALAAQAAAAKAAPSDAMRLEMATLQNQVRTLESQLDEDRKNSARELSTLANQLQTARETNRSLSDANRSLLQARGSDDSAVKAEVDQINGRLKASQAELEKTRTEQARLAAELEARNREYAALQAKSADVARAADQHGNNVAELTGLNEKLSADKATLEKQLALTQQKTDFALAELGDLRKRLANTSKTTEEQLSTIGELGTANDKLKGDLRDLTAQVSTLRAENSRLAAAGESAGSFRAELAEMKTRFTEAQKTSEQQSATVAELTGANEKLGNDVKNLEAQLAALQADNMRLAQSDAARREAEQRAASLSGAAAQLATAQRDLMSSRAELARLNENVQLLERDRSTRIAQLQQENAAITARLRQAQGTLDQIASAARLINGGGPAASALPATSSLPPAAPAPAPAVATPVQPAPRIHTVTEGDSLTRISVRYYGTSNRWQEIYEANREVLKGENALRPGQRLRIP